MITNIASEKYLTLLEDTLLDSVYGVQDLLGTVVSTDDIDHGTYWPLRAHTMIGRRRLRNIRDCFLNVVRDGVPGDLIETGVWRGGACIYMKALVDLYQQRRRVFVADSFEGLPSPDQRYPMDIDISHEKILPLLAVSQAEVESNFKRYGLLDDNVVFVKGWFEHSLAKADIKQLAILRLDGDMYSSTIQVLEQLYDKVSVNGYIIIDDYCLYACQCAVTEFLAKRGIKPNLVQVDWAGVYWKKEA